MTFPLIKDLQTVIEDSNSLILKEFREREPLQDGDPDEVLAPHKIKQLQVMIRKGAKDMDQDWKNAEHLLYKAYSVMGHKLPRPHLTDGWKQFEELLSFTVGVLSSTRGPFAKWRRTEKHDYEDDEDMAIDTILKKVPGYTNTDELPTNPENLKAILKQEDLKRKHTIRRDDV